MILIEINQHTKAGKVLLEMARLLENEKEGVKILGEDQLVYHLTEEQVLAIEEAREQYKKGEFLTNEEVDRETEEWLKK